MTDAEKTVLAVTLYNMIIAAQERLRLTGYETDIYYDLKRRELLTHRITGHQYIYLYRLTAESSDVIDIMALVIDQLDQAGILDG